MADKDINCEAITYPPAVEQRKKMYLSQKGRCKLCGKEVLYDKMQVDHNHTTGVVRGLLCYSCNSRIGYIESCMETEPCLQWQCKLPCKGFIRKVLRYLE